MKGLWIVAVAATLGLMLTGQASALNIDNVSISKNIHRTNGGAPDSWSFDVTMYGSGLNDAIFTNLDTSNFYGLTNAGGGKFEFTKGFASLAAMNAEFDNNVSYWFYFNMHPGPTFDDQVIIGYVPTIPQGFANITFPAHLATDVPLNPNYAWDNAAGIAGNNDLALFVFDSAGGDVYMDVPEANTGLTHWQPGTLSPGTDYSLAVCAVGLMNGHSLPVTTLMGDGFTYFGVYNQSNQVDFTTGLGQEVPEPGTLALMGTAALTILGLGWRRRMK